MSKTPKIKKKKDKQCTGCGVFLNSRNCRRTKRGNKEYFGGKCRQCDVLQTNEYRSTFKGFLVALLSDAKNRAKQRKANGRIEAGVFNLTLQQLFDIYKKQDGKCYYSSIKMNMKTATNWKASIERLDDNKGYTINNSVLVCLEFNGRTKWSNDKINELLIKLKEKVNYDEILTDINDVLVIKKKKRTLRNIKYKTIENIKHWRCDICKEFKTMDEYNDRKSGCVGCRKIIRNNHYNTIRGHLQKLLSHAKYHTECRKNVKNRKNNKDIEDTCDITLVDMVDMLRKQRGLCYYSGIKMNYGLGKNWVCSLERINPSKGYVKGNICLICYEFNTADFRSVTKYSNGGSGGWSIEKFNYFLKNANLPEMQAPTNDNFKSIFEDSILLTNETIDAIDANNFLLAETLELLRGKNIETYLNFLERCDRPKLATLTGKVIDALDNDDFSLVGKLAQQHCKNIRAQWKILETSDMLISEKSVTLNGEIIDALDNDDLILVKEFAQTHESIEAEWEMLETNGKSESKKSVILNGDIFDALDNNKILQAANIDQQHSKAIKKTIDTECKILEIDF